MRYSGITLIEDSTATNLTIASGTSFPSSPTIGELFYRSDSQLLYVYNGTVWASTIGGNGTVTSVDASGGGTGLSFSGGPVTTSGTLTLAGTLAIGSGGTGQTTALAARNALLPAQTSNSGKYLSTDGSNVAWTALPAFLAATSAVTVSAAASGAYVGLVNSLGTLALVNSTASSGARVSVAQALSSGNLEWALADDTAASQTAWLQVARSGNTATNVTLTGTAITLTGAVSGTSFAGDGASLTALNATQLTTGTVGTARLGSGTANSGTFLRGDQTWAAATVTSLAGTGAITTAIGTTAVYAGLASGVPTVQYVNASASANNKAVDLRVTSGGVFQMNLVDDALTGLSAFLAVTRSANTATLITLTSTGLNLATGTGGLQLNGSAGTAGQVLLSQGASASPVWGSATATSLTGSGTVAVGVGSTAAYGGVLTGAASGTFNSRATLALVSSAASAGNRVYLRQVDGSGNLFEYLSDDTQSAATAWLQVARSSNTASTITLTGTAIALTGAVTATSVAGAHTGSLSATGSLTFSALTATDGVHIARRSGAIPSIYLTQSTSAADNRAWRFQVFDNSAVGTFALQTVSDADTTANNVLTIVRSGATPGLATWAAGVTVNGTLTAGGMFASTGSITPSAITTADGVYAGRRAGANPVVYLTQTTSAANSRAWRLNVFDNAGVGTFALQAMNDADTTTSDVMSVARSGATISSIAFTSTAMTQSGTFQAGSLNVTASTAPANGVYLSAANTLALSSNTTARLTINSTGVIATATGTSVDFGARYSELNTAVTATSSTTIDCSLGNIFTVTMSASITTLTFSNVAASGRAFNITLVLKQDGTGGRSVTWPGAVKWPSGTAPTLSAANKTDIVSLLTVDGGTTWWATVTGQNF